MTALIRTFTGLDLDLLDPQPEAIAIEDIAHGLAQTCRFSGQCPRFYSVAEHSVRVSLMVPARDALEALLHDASEAYLSDLVSPLKALHDLMGYRLIEARLMEAIYWRFGLSRRKRLFAESVARADHELVELEMAVFFDGLEIVDLECWAPAPAEGQFLRRFAALSKGGS
jgi:hypothetical protein